MGKHVYSFFKENLIIITRIFVIDVFSNKSYIIYVRVL